MTTAKKQFCLPNAVFDKADDYFVVLPGDERTHLGLRVGGVAHHNGLRDCLDPFEHLIEYRALDQDPRPGNAGLTCVETEDRSNRYAFGGSVKVGIVQDDVGGLTSELEDGWSQSVSRCLLDDLRRRRGAGHRDLLDVSMSDHGITDIAEASDDVDGASWQDFVQEFTEAEASRARLLGGLRDYGVARSKRTGDLVAQHSDRHVVRNDGGNHAIRLANGEAQRLRIERHRPPRRRLERLMGLAIPQGLHPRSAGQLHQPERVAIAGRFKLSELFAVLVKELSNLLQVLRSSIRGQRRPSRECPLGCFDRNDGIVSTALGNSCPYFACGWVDRIHESTGRRTADLSFNQVMELSNLGHFISSNPDSGLSLMARSSELAHTDGIRSRKDLAVTKVEEEARQLLGQQH